jgi:hypothetical protein
VVVYGVLYHLDEDERPQLGRPEGLGKGYQIRRVRVRRDGAEAEEEAFTYFAAPEAVRDDLPPFR